MIADYGEIIKKIEGGEKLNKDEVAITREALEKLFTENAVVANGIVSLIKITGDKNTFSEIKKIVASAKKSVENGMEPLTPEDKKRLRSLLGHLREESSSRICKSIENGSVVFLSMLDKELGKVDVEEIQKLQDILGTLEKTQKRKA